MKMNDTNCPGHIFGAHSSYVKDTCVLPAASINSLEVSAQLKLVTVHLHAREGFSEPAAASSRTHKGLSFVVTVAMACMEK